MSSLSHQRAKELLEAALNGNLISFERAVLENHLRNCKACQQYALELNQFEQNLSQGLKKRWPQPKPRQAELDTLISIIQKRTRRLIPIKRFFHFAQPILLASLSILLISGLIWVLNSFTNYPTHPNDSIPFNFQPADGRQFATQLMTETNLNCDINPEQIQLVLEFRNNENNVAMIYIEEITNNSKRTIWTFNISENPSEKIESVFLVEPHNGCQKFLAAVLSNPDRMIVFQWDGETIKEILNAPGHPTEVITDNNVYRLNPDNEIRVVSTENINPTKCSIVNTTYQWNGSQFIISGSNLNPGQGCQQQNH